MVFVTGRRLTSRLVAAIVTIAAFCTSCLGPRYVPRKDARLKRVCDFWGCRYERDGREYSAIDVAVADNPRAHEVAASASSYGIWTLVTTVSGGLCTGAALVWANDLDRDEKATTPAMLTATACLGVVWVGLILGAKAKQLGADAVNMYNDAVIAEMKPDLVDLVVHLSSEGQNDLSQVLYTLVPGRPAQGADLDEVRRGNGWTSSAGGMSVREPARFDAMPPGVYTLCIRSVGASDPLSAEGFWRWAPGRMPACRPIVVTATPPIQETRVTVPPRSRSRDGTTVPPAGPPDGEARCGGTCPPSLARRVELPTWLRRRMSAFARMVRAQHIPGAFRSQQIADRCNSWGHALAGAPSDESEDRVCR